MVKFIRNTASDCSLLKDSRFHGNDNHGLVYDPIPISIDT